MTTDGLETPQLTPFFHLVRADRAVSELLVDAMAGAELTPLEYAVTSAVVTEPDLTTTQLAERLGVPMTTAATWVGRLVERGVLTKDVATRDRRAHRLVLSRTGERVHRESARAFARGYEAFLSHAESPAERMNDVLIQIAAAATAAVRDLRASAESS